MLNIPAKGGCQCGDCGYVLKENPYVAYACHCQECKKLSASAFLTCMHVSSESVTTTKGQPVSKQRESDSGNTILTWFCDSCGSTLFADNSSRPGIKTLHVGSLEQPEEITINKHIWTKRKIPWIQLPDTDETYPEGKDWSKYYQ